MARQRQTKAIGISRLELFFMRTRKSDGMISTVPGLVTQPNSLLEGRIFNDDLLINDGDLKYARDQFPEVFQLLDHPELRNVFVEYERVAIKARACVRRLGLLAVASATITLLSAATEPLWHSVALAGVLSIIFECFGLVAALVAGCGLWLGPWRKRWLESRFMTERIRQWHFQLLVRRGSEIEVLLGKSTAKASETFRALREKWFNDFLHESQGKLDSRMNSLANDADFSSDWLHQPPSHFNKDSQVLGRVFDAYRRLRFLHQYDFATHKLTESSDLPFWQFLKWPLIRQESAIRGAVASCFIAALLCSIGVIVNRNFEIKPSIDPYLGSVTLLIAIVGVALRTIQEGLGIAKEIERYRDYRGKVRRLFSGFEAAANQETKLRLMEDMELAVVDELKSFIRTHQNAGFML